MGFGSEVGTILHDSRPTVAYAEAWLLARDALPFRREHRFFYPIDWPQLSAVIRFGRAKKRCEGCGRPHGRTVVHRGDGRWWDDEAAAWRDGAGAIVCLACRCRRCARIGSA